MNKNSNEGNIEKIKSAIEVATGETTKVIAVPTEVIHFAGTTQKGVFLSQLIYWSDKGSRSDGFFYKTAKEWEEEIGLSDDQIRRYTKDFASLGIIETKIKKANGCPTTYYKLNVEKARELIMEFSEDRISKKADTESQETWSSLTESTSDSTDTSFSSESDSSNDEFRTFSGNKNLRKQTDFNHSLDDATIKGTFFADGLQKVACSSPGHGKIRLPDDFEPTIAEKYVAAVTFPTKSPQRVTKRLTNHYRDSVKAMTLSEWHNEWWNWMNLEKPGCDNAKFRDEHSAIFSEAGNAIWNLGSSYVCIPSELYKNAESKGFSARVVDSILEHLLKSEKVVACDGFYFTVISPEVDPGYEAKLFDELIDKEVIPDWVRTYEEYMIYQFARR